MHRNLEGAHTNIARCWLGPEVLLGSKKGRAIARKCPGELGQTHRPQASITSLHVALRLSELDILGADGEVQGAQRLGDIALRGRALHDHQRLRVAAERVLQHHRELRVPVGHVLGLGRQGGDHAAQRGQALVDVLGLLDALARHARLAHVFGAGQVDEVDLAVVLPRILFFPRLGLRHHLHDAVGPARLLVHVRRHHGPVRRRVLHGLQHLLHGVHRELREAGHGAGAVGVRPHLELLLLRDEQVLDRLIVYLGDHQGDRDVGVQLALLPDAEELGQDARVEPRVALVAGHRERLPGPRLAVREDADVEAVEHRRRQRLHLLVHVLLRRLRGERLVELEPLPPRVVPVVDGDLAVLREGDRGLAGRLARLLLLVNGPDAHEDPDVPLQFQHDVVELPPLLGHLAVALHQAVRVRPDLLDRLPQRREGVRYAAQLGVALALGLLLPRPELRDVALEAAQRPDERLREALGRGELLQVPLVFLLEFLVVPHRGLDLLLEVRLLPLQARQLLRLQLVLLLQELLLGALLGLLQLLLQFLHALLELLVLRGRALQGLGRAELRRLGALRARLGRLELLLHRLDLALGLLELLRQLLQLLLDLL
mmetsp:Transcript_84363/g.239284  ORF Transcript_84363/g.239284 Transcript_84363/m.239284 type:complete len:600 (+) Transcript_84363:3-1802(+)